MPHEALTGEPTELTAGESWRWDRAFGDHPPSDGWTLKYALRGETDRDVEATPNGDVYEVRLDIATTASVAPGPYRLVGYLEDDPATERHVVYDATLLVHPSPLAAVNRKTHAAEALAVIEAAIEGRLTADQQEYQINGRAVTKIPILELRRLRGLYADEVRRQRKPGRIGRPVEVTFAPPR